MTLDAFFNITVLKTNYIRKDADNCPPYKGGGKVLISKHLEFGTVAVVSTENVLFRKKWIGK